MKKKLALDVNTLQVESFDLSGKDRSGRGTIHAHVTEVGGNSCYTQCSGTNFTDWNSCVGGCSDSGCNGRPCQTE
ncbi:MAG TPA: hypothetical protein VGB15_24455 [Longimicrobium sp.]|jgi:hypothetical protein